MRLRQLALAAKNLAPHRRVLFELLGVTEDYQDPGVGEFGLENSVMTLGETFLEIVAPVQANTAVHRALAKAGADACGYMALLQIDDFKNFAARADTMQLRKIWQVQRPEVSACHIHPKDIPGAIVSFDEMRPAPEWVWAGPKWRTRAAADVNGITGMVFESTDAEAMARRWSEITECKLEPKGSGLRLLLADETFVDFKPAAHDRLGQFVIRCDEPARIRQRAESMGLVQADKIQLGSLELLFI